MKLRTLAASGCFVIAGGHSLGSASAAGEQKSQSSQSHGERAQLHYDMGRWDEAIGEFEAAYAGSSDPTYLYKMAETCRRKGDHPRAIDLYKNYLEKVPESPLRPEIEAKVSALRAQSSPASPGIEAGIAISTSPTMAQSPVLTPVTSNPADTQPIGTVPVAPAPTDVSRNAQTPATSSPLVAAMPPPQVAPKPNSMANGTTMAPVSFPVQGATPQSGPAPSGEPSTSGARIFGVVMTGMGIATLGVGGYFSWRTKDIESDINSSSSYNPSQYASGRQAQTLQWVLYGAGAGLTLTGVILYAVGGGANRSPEPRVSLVPSIWSNSAGLSAQGAL